MYKILALFLLLAFCPLVFAQQTMMDNDAVAKMVSAGLSDDIVIATINASPGQYDTTDDAVIGLEHAGVSDKVITAMRRKGSYTVVHVTNTTRSAPAQTVLLPTPPVPPPATPALPPAVQRPTPESAGFRPAANKPRVYLESASKGNNQNAARDQSMEMSKDLERNCPAIRVTIIQQMADYTILLNHIEVGLFVRDNQIQVANRDGDLISRTREGGSIKGDVKKACDLILADWAAQSH
jgi:hypothetical protein